MSIKISFEPLTVFAKIPILYAWIGSQFAFDTCINSK